MKHMIHTIKLVLAAACLSLAGVSAHAADQVLQYDGKSYSVITQTRTQTIGGNTKVKKYYGLADSTGKVVIEPRFSLIAPLGDEGLALFGKLRLYETTQREASHFVPWDGIAPAGIPIAQRLERSPDYIVAYNLVDEDSRIRYDTISHYNKTTRIYRLYDAKGELLNQYDNVKSVKLAFNDQRSKVTGINLEYGQNQLATLDPIGRLQKTHSNTQRVVFEEGTPGERMYYITPTENDPTLFYVLRDGNFTTPPGSLGVRVMTRPHRKKLGSKPAGKLWINQYTDHSTKNAAWMVAYPSGQKGKYLWGGANLDFSWIGKPEWTEYLLKTSVERKHGKAVPASWQPDWLIMRHKDDGKWVISKRPHPGTAVEQFGRHTSANAAFTSAESAVRSINQAQATALKQQQSIDAANASKAQSANAVANFNNAVRSKDHEKARYWAFAAGGNTLSSYLNSGWATQADFERASNNSNLSESQRNMYANQAAKLKRNEEVLAQQAEARRQQQAYEEQQAAEAAYWQSRAQAHKDKWRNWQTESSTALNKNMQAVREQSFKNNVEAYKKGYINQIPEY